MSKRQMRQGGSALVYALVAGVLVVVLAGGLFWLRQYKAPEEVATSESSNATQSEKKSEDKQKTPSDQPQSSDKSSDQTDTKNDDRVQSQSTDHSDKDVPTLPVTGPQSGAWQLLAFTLLTFAGVSYYTSRHHRWTSRDK